MVIRKHYKPVKKIKQEKRFFMFVLLLIGLVFLYSLYRITVWFLDSRSLAIQLESINQNAQTNEIDHSKGENFNPPQDGFDPYWDYINTNLLDVDLEKLKTINQQTKGWIQVKGTNINYPFVQTENNDYYLNHSFNKKHNLAGWIFLDYRNDINNLGANTIIYGHGRVGDTMFGTLKNIVKSSWYSNKENHLVRISSDKHNSVWQVFSVYEIDTTNDYLQTSFSAEKEYSNFLNLIGSRSQLDFNTRTSYEDKILTLSTCLNNTKKTVMHAKLINIQYK